MDVKTIWRKRKRKFKLMKEPEKLNEMKKSLEQLKFSIGQREKGIQEAEIDIVQWKNLIEELELCLLKRDFNRYEVVFL